MQWKEMKKTIQDLKVEIESIKKTQTEGNLEMKNLETQMGTTKTSLANRIQEIDERISGIEEMIEEIDTSIKKMVNLKTPGSKHPVNLRHCEKTKSKNNRTRGRRNPAQRLRKLLTKS